MPRQSRFHAPILHLLSPPIHSPTGSARGTLPFGLLENTPEARQALLEELGYELTDLDLWEAWLFLEEASAEKIIRHLIRWFVPSLQGKLRTFSAKGVDKVEPKFEDFNILISYLHLQPAYKHRAWVMVDGGEKEQAIIARLKKTYGASGWNERNFQYFTEHDFESYYPPLFKEKVEQVLMTENRKEKWEKKKALLNEVETWINAHDNAAREAFETSASEVITKLKAIETELHKGKTN